MAQNTTSHPNMACTGVRTEKYRLYFSKTRWTRCMQTYRIEALIVLIC